MLKVNKHKKVFSILTIALAMIIYISVNHSFININVQAASLTKLEKGKIKQEKLIKILKQQKEEKLDKLENQIKVYLGSNINNIGLSYYDINSGRKMIINGSNTFLAGSTIKVQMNMVLADLFKNGQASVNEKLQYTPDCYETGTGILQGTDFAELQNPLPIMLLSKYSIIHSDNIATNMIIKSIGYEKLRDDIDIKLGHVTNHSGNYITANDETKLLKILYENPTKNPYYPIIIKNMKNTDFHDRIDLYIPRDIVAHKIGDYDSYVNDVGIIYTKQPFILSVYTNEVVNANQVIAHVSKMIYDYQNTL